MKTMDMRARRSLISFGLTALLAIGAATAQIAANAQIASRDTGIDASGNYQTEVQACMSGQTQQDRATCLQEARNAKAEKQRGRLEDGGNLQANALRRCEVFQPGEDKAACQARVMGYGNVDGSVAGGGLLREVETVVLPEGQTTVNIDAKTEEPVVLLPSQLK
jgi:hypothetical protein